MFNVLRYWVSLFTWCLQYRGAALAGLGPLEMGKENVMVNYASYAAVDF